MNKIKFLLIVIDFILIATCLVNILLLAIFKQYFFIDNIFIFLIFILISGLEISFLFLLRKKIKLDIFLLSVINASSLFFAFLIIYLKIILSNDISSVNFILLTIYLVLISIKLIIVFTIHFIIFVKIKNINFDRNEDFVFLKISYIFKTAIKNSLYLVIPLILLGLIGGIFIYNDFWWLLLIYGFVAFIPIICFHRVNSIVLKETKKTLDDKSFNKLIFLKNSGANNYAFGNELTKLRRSHKFSQKHLAKLLNTSDKTISRWENGYNYPSIEELGILSKIYKQSLFEILKKSVLDE